MTLKLPYSTAKKPHLLSSVTGMDQNWTKKSPRIRQRGFQHVILAVLGIWVLYKLFAGYVDMHSSHRYPITPYLNHSHGRPAVGKVSMIYGDKPIYERAMKTHEEHSRRLGYPLHVLRNPIVEGTYNKYAVLMSIMLQELEKPASQRLQWLLWFDSDTVLLNPNMPLETFLPPPELSDIHLLLTQDWNGMNNGVFFIRVHEWSVKLLAAAISYTTVHPDADLYWTDQSALDNIFEDVEFFSKSVLYCPLRWFNAYMRSPDGLSPNKDSPDRLQVHPGDLLVHFPGTPPDDLVQTMEPYIQIAEGHHKEWELPVEETAYVKIVKEFWDKERRRAGYPEPSMTWSSSEPS